MKTALRRLLTHKVRLTKRGRSATGDWVDLETYEDVPAFVQWGRTLAVNDKGEEIAAAAIIFLDATAPFDPTHPHWAVQQTHPYERPEVQVETIDVIDYPRTGQTHHYELAVR